MKVLLIPILIFLFLSKIRAQHSTVNRAVVFIYTTEQEGYKPLGTGFYEAIPLTKDSSKVALFLCTAKHVLLMPDSSFRKAVAIRLNTKDSSRFTFTKLQTEGPDKNVFVHSNSTVDLAVIYGAPSKTDYTFEYIPVEVLLNRDEHNRVEEGAEIFFSGLFTPYLGRKRNFPIIRFGHVALKTDEMIEFVGYQRELILIESMAFGGNSGSPVFMNYQNKGFRILGVLNGYFNSASPIQIMRADADIPVSISNIGIAAITPSYLLVDIFKSKELMERLESVKKKYLLSN